MRMPMAARCAVLIAASCLSVACARADAARDQAWREDLKTWTTQLRVVHPKPFAHVPEARFDSAAAALDAAVPQLTDARVAVGIMRLDAMLQDGHTLVAPVSRAMGFGRVVPVRIYVFEDGPWISAVGPPTRATPAPACSRSATSPQKRRCGARSRSRPPTTT
jgi:hypothetical protein